MQRPSEVTALAQTSSLTKKKEVKTMKKNNLLFSLALTATMLFAVSVQARVQQKFVAALNSMQVVPTNNSTARGHCIVTEGQPMWLDVTCEYSGLSSDLTRADIRFRRVGQSGSVICGPLFSGGTNGSFSSTCKIISGWFPPHIILPMKFAYIEFQTVNFPSGEIRGQIKPVTLDSDVDGDSRTDAFLYRPSDACSFALCSVNGSTMVHQFDGLPSDSNPFLADFDGDGIADYSFTRVVLTDRAIYTIYLQSGDNTVRQVQWGNADLGDQSAHGDYDRDGKIDIAVFRPTDGVWYILQSSDGRPQYDSWGTNKDNACPGDYDKDGKTDLCVIRNENDQLTWYIRRSSNGQFFAVHWGLATDKIFPASPVDVDADGANDILVSRDRKGQRVFYALRSSDNSTFVLQWGLSSDGIKMGDFDGDGKTDFGALRNIEGRMIWFVWQSLNGQMRIFSWGLPGDL